MADFTLPSLYLLYSLEKTFDRDSTADKVSSFAKIISVTSISVM
jgi:hypothetical protein